MRIVKGYDMFVEGRTTKSDNKIIEPLNEGLFTKIAQGIKNFIGGLWNKIKSKYGKHAWWYAGMLLHSKTKGQNTEFEFCPYSVSEGEAESIAKEVSKLSSDTTTETTSENINTLSFTDQMINESYDKMLEKYNRLNEENLARMDNTPHRIVNARSLAETIVDKYNMLVQEAEEFESDDDYYNKGTEKSPLFIWGAPGIGKTSIVKQCAKHLEVDLIVWHLSMTEPSDLLGVPGKKMIDGVERTVFYLPQIFPTSNGANGKGCIIFFDEMNRAPSSVLKACLNLVLEGKIGTYMLPSKVLVIAAGNPASTLGGDADVTVIEPSLMNRFAHVTLVLTKQDFKEWASTQVKNPILPDVVDFITGTYGSDYFHRLDLDQQETAWPSPRAWVTVSRALLSKARGNMSKVDYDKLTPEEKFALVFTKLSNNDIINIAHESVGSKAALEFGKYVKLKESFPEEVVELIFTDPKNAPPLPTRVDVTAAVADNIAAYKKCLELDITKVPSNLMLSVEELDNFLKYVSTGKRAELEALVVQKFLKNHPWIMNKVNVSNPICKEMAVLVINWSKFNSANIKKPATV